MTTWRHQWIVGSIEVQPVNGALALVEQGALFDSDALTDEEATECDLLARVAQDCSA